MSNSLSNTSLILKSTPRGKQVEAVQKGIESTRGGLWNGFGLFCEPSTGKTFMTLAILAHWLELGKLDKLVIIAPSRAILANWQDEIIKHFTDYGIELFNNKVDLHLVTYGQIPHWGAAVKNALLDDVSSNMAIIFDESHYIKNPLSITGNTIGRYIAQFSVENPRFKNKYIASIAPMLISLTGTPFGSSWGDVIMQNFITDGIYGSERMILGAGEFESYTKEQRRQAYKDEIKYQTSSTLNSIKYNAVVLRKEDVYQPMPKNFVEVDNFDCTGISPGNMCDQNHFTDEQVHESYFDRLRSVNGYVKHEGAVNHKFEQLLDNPKLKALHDLIKGFGDKKAVIYGQMIKDVEMISELMDSMGLTYSVHVGNMRKDQKQQAINDFKQGNAQFIIATLASLNAGIELTEASEMVFYNITTKLIDYIQGQDRINRPSTITTTNYYLFTGGAFGKRALTSLNNKMKRHDFILSAIDGGCGYGSDFKLF